jgi:4-alpha-glucanotransferase
MVRIDHFRGFEAYWAIPAEAPDARSGSWRPGPGRPFFDALRAELGDLPIIAEDLGIITPAVEELRDGLELPGMKILHFAFGGNDDHPYLPHNYPVRCVAYTGTHDNDTTVGWYATCSPAEADDARRYFGIDGAEIAWQLMDGLWRSPAQLALVPAQDLLSLGSEERMNRPGSSVGNWCWRLRDGALDAGVAARLRELSHRYGRS